MDQLVRVLIVDDNRDDRELASRCLRKEFDKIEIIEANDQRSFLQALKPAQESPSAGASKSMPDVIITDYQLRWTTGLEILSESLAKYPEIPVIMFTNTGTEEVCAKAMRQGLFDYIVKRPQHFVKLPPAIRAALNSVETQRRLAAEQAENQRYKERLEKLLAEQELLNETLEDQVKERTKLAEDRAAKLRRLAAELTYVEQQERKRISQLLHDQLQQTLVAARLRLRVFHEEAAPDLREDSFQFIDKLLEQAIGDSRSLVSEISPPVVHEMNIHMALSWLAKHMGERHGLDVAFTSDSSTCVLDDDVKIFLFNAAKELLFNVIKHSSTQQAELHSSVADGQYKLIVSDHGQGFDSRILEQRDFSHNEGFGLFSIRERIEALGGTLTPANRTSGGAKFTLTVSCESNPDSGPAQETTPSTSDNPPGNSLIPVTVLLVDDHAIVRDGMKRILDAHQQIEVLGEAADGIEACEKAKELKPHVVLMDISMPNRNGVEATKIILEQTPLTQVIAVSMHDSDEMIKEIFQAGAKEFVHKGDASTSLIKTILKVAACSEE